MIIYINIYTNLIFWIHIEIDYLDDNDNNSNASFATRSSASSASKRLRNNLGQGIKV